MSACSTLQRHRLGPDRGFTLVEIMVVIVIIGILTTFAQPAFVRLKNKARAAAIVGELHTIEAAVFDYNASLGHWPTGDDVGSVPASIQNNLPPTFSFQQADYSLVYRNLSEALATDLRVGVQTANTDLGRTVLSLVGPSRSLEREGTYWVLILNDNLEIDASKGEDKDKDKDGDDDEGDGDDDDDDAGKKGKGGGKGGKGGGNGGP